MRMNNDSLQMYGQYNSSNWLYLVNDFSIGHLPKQLNRLFFLVFLKQALPKLLQAFSLAIRNWLWFSTMGHQRTLALVCAITGKPLLGYDGRVFRSTIFERERQPLHQRCQACKTVDGCNFEHLLQTMFFLWHCQYVFWLSCHFLLILLALFPLQEVSDIVSCTNP